MADFPVAGGGAAVIADGIFKTGNAVLSQFRTDSLYTTFCA
jgi:hypothetical protein